MGPKICPSGPAMVNSGRKAQTMIAVEKNRLRWISPDARMIRSWQRQLGVLRRLQDGGRCSRP